MCVDYSGDYGVNVACTDQQIVTAVCTSDAGASCGNAYTRIQCCDGTKRICFIYHNITAVNIVI